MVESIYAKSSLNFVSVQILVLLAKRLSVLGYLNSLVLQYLSPAVNSDNNSIYFIGYHDN